MAITVSKPLRILILGGTGFIGPHYVRAALAREHKVAVFNRGKGHADFPATVEQLIGDRNRDLGAIKDRIWDAVVDLATYGPGWVRSLGETLKGRATHYTFISSIAVYENLSANTSTGENCKVIDYKGSADPYLISKLGEHTAALKVLCEREAEKQFPGRTLILRPGYIVGPGEPNEAFHYWPARMERGGEILVTGDPSMPVQFIDARDLAQWSVRMIERGVTGVYNTVGPPDRISFGQMLTAAGEVVSASPQLTWVSSTWLAGRSDGAMWGNLLFWSTESPYGSGAMRVNIEKAVANGLTTRSPNETLADTLQWHKNRPEEDQAGPVTGANINRDGTGWDLIRSPWPAYVERERETLAAWRSADGPKLNVGDE
jgi:2'-hydroxyisoflavone reductase